MPRLSRPRGWPPRWPRPISGRCWYAANRRGASTSNCNRPWPAGGALPTETECEAVPKSRSLTQRHPMPLRVAYATCAVVGQLRFYPGVYGRDEIIRRQLFGR